MCADRSVSARRYDRSGFRLTKNYAGPKNDEKPRKTRKNRGKSDFTPSRFSWVALFFHVELPINRPMAATSKRCHLPNSWSRNDGSSCRSDPPFPCAEGQEADSEPDSQTARRLSKVVIRLRARLRSWSFTSRRYKKNIRCSSPGIILSPQCFHPPSKPEKYK